jgi:hypothetical protein
MVLLLSPFEANLSVPERKRLSALKLDPNFLYLLNHRLSAELIPIPETTNPKLRLARTLHGP